ncbi:MAG TPA: alpha/beta hydrolase [Flavobacteriales bacterium]|nr:alpha/beta hydrolase [Flavobacteriales bacterium]|tara:strand:- start:129026 stop:129793 length:768 start_codon:yes stop_codon:yes gene_type:complete
MELNYKKLGEKEPTLIILHGLFGMLDNWMSLAKRFSEYFTVYLVDARNHGQSPWSDEFNYKVMAEDLREFIEQHQIENPVVLGHSMGGKTAMQFAMDYPDRLQKLIVVDIAPKSYPVHHKQILDALLELNKTEITSRRQADELLSKYIENFAIRQFLLKNLYWKDKNRLALRFNLEVINRNIEIIGQGLENIRPFDKPTLFIRGKLSNYITEEDYPMIKNIFPKAEIITFEKAGHWVHAEAPQQFFETVKDFVLK